MAGFFVGKEVKMKNYSKYEFEKRKDKTWKKEQKGGFKCSHCRQWVVINEFMGTANRNHCNLCLWSKHVDDNKGDRKSSCLAGMQPIGLTFKQEGQGKQGEIMLIHLCSVCERLSINRIAADDMSDVIIAVFDNSQDLDNNLKQELLAEDIYLLENTDRQGLIVQLFGK